MAGAFWGPTIALALAERTSPLAAFTRAIAMGRGRRGLLGACSAIQVVSMIAVFAIMGMAATVGPSSDWLFLALPLLLAPWSFWAR